MGAPTVSMVFTGIAELKREMRRIDRSTNRATMYAVRQAGRKVKQAGMRNAPVYQGDRADIPKGRLKKSIHSDKRLGRFGVGGYSVRVGPRGWPVNGYAPKREAESGFMLSAYESVTPQLEGIAIKAWATATRGRR